MIDNRYIKLLEKYINNTLKVSYDNETLTVYYDVEVKYLLKKISSENYLFYLSERGRISLIASYFSEHEMKRRFAMSIKSFFARGIDYSNMKLFEPLNSIDEVDKLMKLHIGEKYYSINNPLSRKMNLQLTTDNKFDIYFLSSKNIKKYTEKEQSKDRAFPRFYSDSLFLKNRFEIINQYIEVFRDEIEECELDNYLL